MRSKLVFAARGEGEEFNEPLSPFLLKLNHRINENNFKNMIINNHHLRVKFTILPSLFEFSIHRENSRFPQFPNDYYESKIKRHQVFLSRLHGRIYIYNRETTGFNYPREGFSRVETRGKLKGADNRSFFFPLSSFSLPPAVSVPAGSQRPPAMNIWIRESHGTGAPVSFPVAGTRQLAVACAIVNEKTTKMKEEGGLLWGISVAYKGAPPPSGNTWIRIFLLD